jgi:SAM-dependent methyltransferase
MSEEYPAHLYAAVHDGTPGDVEFYRRRCAGARSIVELGCGDARVLAALAEPGRVLVGVDVDPQQLELAAARGPSSLELCEADMSALDDSPLCGGRFERVIVPHGGLYCLLDEAAVAEALAGAAALLADDGLLILDAWAADGFHAEAEPEDQDPGWLEHVKAIELDGERWEVLERSSWDKQRQRLDVTYVHVRVGEEEAVEGLLRQRYVLAAQLRGALASAGLELVELFGDFEGSPYGADSPTMVAIARRAV